jgi:3D-(3,5/4)-trihydroxycyclohexane-1,2-dione acylhydrolase (decyclizing)
MGFNMQQVPATGLFLQMAATMGRAYSLHTPLALPAALQRGAATVDHPTRPGPYYLLLPMNTQAAWLPDFNLEELPEARSVVLGSAVSDYACAAQWIHEADRVLIKVGGGGRDAGSELTTLLERAGAVLVHTPIATGCIPYAHPQNMAVGGSKGSLCGNYAMGNADLLIAVGTRAVCQSDCSRTGYLNVKRVININADVDDATHYHHTLALVGDVRRTLDKLNETLGSETNDKAQWLTTVRRRRPGVLQTAADMNPVLHDEYWDEWY